MHLASAGSGTASSRVIAAPVSDLFAVALAVDVASVAVALQAVAKLTRGPGFLPCFFVGRRGWPRPQMLRWTRKE